MLQLFELISGTSQIMLLRENWT